jgi:hypothetical protein
MHLVDPATDRVVEAPASNGAHMPSTPLGQAV